MFDSLAPDGSTTRADATGTALTYEVHGKAPQGEAGNLEVTGILIQRLNCDGAHWGDLKDIGADKQRREDGVDCEASDGTKTLRMQITRVRPDEQFWPSLGRHGVAVGIAKAQEAAKRLHAAIMGKSRIPPKQRAALVLVISALLSAGSAFDVVTAAFLDEHGGWARNLGFQAIWVVGPNPDLTARLDISRNLAGTSCA